MNGVWLLLIVPAALAAGMIWAFRVLPREEWQFIAAVPGKKDSSGAWTGRNLTFYGLFTANAYVLAAALFFFLSGSVGVTFLEAVLLLTLLLGVCVPASRVLALIIDKTQSGFTVGGAAFVGLLSLPAAVLLLNAMSQWADGHTVPFAATLAAAAISYCFGESVGRLACISFGCCYGKPLAESGTGAARLFRNLHFVFHGHSKKLAYAGGLEGVKVVPVQALTAVLYSLTGIAGAALFFGSRYTEAFVLTTVVSQIWRAYSETLRADYRGAGKITVYQMMALAAVPAAGCIAYAMPMGDTPVPSAAMGAAIFWNPLALLFLQAIWVAIFLLTGVSETTGSVLSFHVTPAFRNRTSEAGSSRANAVTPE